MEEVYKEHGRDENRNPSYTSKFSDELIKMYLPLKIVVLKSDGPTQLYRV